MSADDRPRAAATPTAPDAAAVPASPAPGSPAALAELRGRIDALDAEMHQLLVKRSEIIEALISVKGTDRPGAAFRPAREASMMHALVDRHRGRLPIVTVEHVWREIISTFTWLQQGYTVHVATGDAHETRDIARFYFGFTVPFVTTERPEEAIAAVGRSTSDLAVIRIGAVEGAWWSRLGIEAEPRIIGRLPFIDQPGRPVATPAVVISMALKDPVAPEIAVFSTTGPADAAARARLAAAGIDVIAHAGLASGATALLVAVDTGAGDADPAAVAAAAAEAGVALGPLRPVGGYARPIVLPAAD